MQILLIEDDERIVEFVKRGLEAEGYGLTVTDDGEGGEGHGRARRVERHHPRHHAAWS